MRQEMKEKEKKAEARQTELVRQAAVEHLRVQFGGKKVKPTCATLNDQLEKACKCAKKYADGIHDEKCSFHPARLKEALQRLAQDRASVEKQLRKTSLAPAERQKALEHLFGPN